MPPSSPFTPEQETWIVTTFPQLNSLTAVKRKFRIVFKVIPKQVSREKSFKSKRVVDRFSLTGSVHNQKPAGRPVSQICEENIAIARVKEMVDEDKTISIRYMVDHFNFSPPSSLEELQNTVTEYTSSLDREEVIRASKDIIVRAKVCKAALEGPSECKLKKSKKKINNEE